MDLAICLLQGQKNSAPLYAEIKRYCHSQKGVPVQVVLTKTIQSGKGLRSICNKILTQMTAKVGGVPWTMSDMPFSSQPTMIMGIDIFQKVTPRKKKYVSGIVATIDRYMGKYYSDAKMTTDIMDAHKAMGTLAMNCFKKFHEKSGRYPSNVVIYRDSASEG